MDGFGLQSTDLQSSDHPLPSLSSIPPSRRRHWMQRTRSRLQRVRKAKEPPTGRWAPRTATRLIQNTGRDPNHGERTVC